jgi:hypothetical protein
MMSLENVPQRIHDGFQYARTAAVVSAGTVLFNVLLPHEFIVRDTDSIGKQALLAYPSALPDPSITGDRAHDVAVDTTFTALGTGLAAYEVGKGNTTPWGMVGVVGLSQAAGSIATGAISPILTPAERAEPNVGNSSILAGIVAKASMDHLAIARQRGEKKKAAAIVAGQTALTLAATFGAYVLEGSNGGLEDAVAHLAGIAAGVAAYFVGKWQRRTVIDSKTAKLVRKNFQTK